MLAYIDSFAGLIACKVISIEESPNRVRYVKVKITSRRHESIGYKCGSIHEFTSRIIVPRDKILQRKYKTMILPYDLANYMPIQLSLDTNR